MKFGKTLTAAQYGPWQDLYIPYKDLKRILKTSAGDPAVFAEAEGTFMTQLLRSVRAVDDFFGCQVTGLRDRVTSLRRSCAEAERALPLSQVSTEVELVAEGVEWLRRYVLLNKQAVHKILKKHDKTSSIALSSSLMPFVDECGFSSFSHVDALLSESQALLTKLVDGRACEQAGTGIRDQSASSSPVSLVAPPASLLRRDVADGRGRQGEVGTSDEASVVSSAVGGAGQKEQVAWGEGDAAYDEVARRLGLQRGLLHAPPARPSLPAADASSGTASRRQACVECHRAKAACVGYPCSRCVRLGRECITREKRKRRRTTRGGADDETRPSEEISGLAAAAAAASLDTVSNDFSAAFSLPPVAAEAENCAVDEISREEITSSAGSLPGLYSAVSTHTATVRAPQCARTLVASSALSSVASAGAAGETAQPPSAHCRQPAPPAQEWRAWQPVTAGQPALGVGLAPSLMDNLDILSAVAQRTQPLVRL